MECLKEVVLDLDINLKLENLKQAIFNEISHNNFPPSMVYYFMKDVMRKIETDYENYINMAIQKQKKLQQENDEKDQEE